MPHGKDERGKGGKLESAEKCEDFNFPFPFPSPFLLVSF